MALFDFFKKAKIDWVTLPQPDDSMSFFEAIKIESEKFWADTTHSKEVYGFQIQQNTKWRKGLDDSQIKSFENSLGFYFPEVLRNFYKTMNGTDKEAINLYGSDGTPKTFNPIFYSYPDDLVLIQEKINWIYEAMFTSKNDLEQLGGSKIFPVFGHRFLMIDLASNPILSMYGNDIVYAADNLSKLLANEIFDGSINNVSDFESPPQHREPIKFWLD